VEKDGEGLKMLKIFNSISPQKYQERLTALGIFDFLFTIYSNFWHHFSNL